MSVIAEARIRLADGTETAPGGRVACWRCHGGGIDKRGMYDTYCSCPAGEEAKAIGCLDDNEPELETHGDR